MSQSQIKKPLVCTAPLSIGGKSLPDGPTWQYPVVLIPKIAPKAPKRNRQPYYGAGHAIPNIAGAHNETPARYLQSLENHSRQNLMKGFLPNTEADRKEGDSGPLSCLPWKVPWSPKEQIGSALTRREAVPAQWVAWQR